MTDSTTMIARPGGHQHEPCPECQSTRILTTDTCEQTINGVTVTVDTLECQGCGWEIEQAGQARPTDVEVQWAPPAWAKGSSKPEGQLEDGWIVYEVANESAAIAEEDGKSVAVYLSQRDLVEFRGDVLVLSRQTPTIGIDASLTLEVGEARKLANAVLELCDRVENYKEAAEILGGAR